MKIRILLSSVAVLWLAACGPIHPPTTPPSPIPSPTPTPTPKPPESTAPRPTLLTVKKVGGQFTNEFRNAEGKRVWLLGYGGVCCHADNAKNGWEMISESWLRELAAHGGNFVHIRVGPYSHSLEPGRPNRVPYLDDGSWNPAFFAELESIVKLADELGVYVEIALTDPWSFKDPSNNYWGVGVEVMRKAPTLTVQHFINKVVLTIGSYENVLWESGNESGVPMNPDGSPIVSIEWELGIISAAEVQEIKSGFPRHLRSTNAGVPKIDRHGDIDFIETHQCQAPEQPHYTGKPVMVNECNPESFSNFQKQLGIAETNGTYYQLWVSDMPEAQRQASLDLIASYRKTHPTK